MPMVSYSRIAASFSARTKRQTVGTRSRSTRQRSREPTRTVSLPPRDRIDPYLLELHGFGRPGRGLGLEQDHAVLDPQPRPPLLDLASRAPAEPVGVAAYRIDAELLLVRGGARRQEQLEIFEPRRAKPGPSRRRELSDDEHRLPRTIFARAGKIGPCLVPQLRDRVRLTDQHSRRGADDVAGECAAALARRDDVDPHVAQSEELAAVDARDETARALAWRRPRGRPARQDPARRIGESGRASAR